MPRCIHKSSKNAYPLTISFPLLLLILLVYLAPLLQIFSLVPIPLHPNFNLTHRHIQRPLHNKLFKLFIIPIDLMTYSAWQISNGNLTKATIYGLRIHIKPPFLANGLAKYFLAASLKLYLHTSIMPFLFYEVTTSNPPTLPLQNSPDIVQNHSN